MKRTAHFCDICWPRRLTLAADRLLGAKLDLCEAHLPKRQRKVRADKGQPRATARAKERKPRSNKGKEVAPWREREATVLSLLPSAGTVSTVDLWRQVTRLAKEKTMPPGAYRKVMQRLRQRGFIKQIGSRSRTKYARANGKA